MSAALASAAVATANDEAPTDVASLAELIAGASEPLAVVGGATKDPMLRPSDAPRRVSTRALDGITLYAPKELVLAARAGTPLATIETAAAAEGQHLVAEPPDLSRLLGTAGTQTVGGVVATNLSGPRRVAWGATRDQVLGVVAVNGRGEVIRSGGRVLKNVTGLDLAKLLTGSFGTLAVLTEITLKVMPAPERRATVAVATPEPARGVAALAAALGSPYGVSGAAYLPANVSSRVPTLASLDGGVAIARLEDFAASVAYRSGRLRDELAAFGPAEILDDGATTALWADVRDAVPLVGAGEAVWRVSVRPSAGPAVAAAIGADAMWFLDWGGGLVWITGSRELHGRVAEAARAARGTWMLLRAPENLRRAVDVLPPETPGLARITREVKAAFDPRSILNPGRMWASV